MRKLNPDEVHWLADYPLGSSHGIIGGVNLAACDNCEWVAQAETIDFLMSQVTQHLEDTFDAPTQEEWDARRQAFITEFGWDPWGEGEVLHKKEEDTRETDVLIITEQTMDGEVVSRDFFTNDLGPEDFDEGE